MGLQQLKILVTGAGGMLAGDLAPILAQTGCDYLLTDLHSKDNGRINSLDITSEEAVNSVIEKFLPDWILNCAAYTAVDRAETDYQTAFAVNSLGPTNLAYAAKRFNSKLLQISTDYVFGGISLTAGVRSPIKEEESCSPCGVYGYSKFFADKLIAEILPQSHLIVRTSWLHGIYGPNFVDTIQRLCSEKSEIRVVNDQIGSPTWAGWLANVMLKLINKNALGIFNVTCQGDISWYDFAQEIVVQKGFTTKILPQNSAELGRPAPRPFYSTLDLSKLENFLGEKSISWREGLKQHLLAQKIVN